MFIAKWTFLSFLLFFFNFSNLKNYFNENGKNCTLSIVLSYTTVYIVYFSCIINWNIFCCRSGLSFTDLYGNYNYQKSFHTQLCDKTTPACDDYKQSKYRSANGVCNNLKNPTWGVALHAHARYLPAVYADGKYIKFYEIDLSMLLSKARKAKTSIIYKSVILKFDKY